MDARTTWPALLGALIRGESLSAEEAAWAMNEIMEGAATPSQIAGFGVALRMKGETPAEMTGLAQAMLDHAAPISVPGRIVDLVGTGGDRARTVNISTMGTIAAAAAGALMVKHGNRAASSACGTADVLEALGIVIDLPPAATEQLVEEVGAGFLFAALYHPALRHTAVPRRELGVPTVFNFLGPLANPARPKAMAMGVADPRMGPILAGVLAGRGCSALVFHGDDGLDELTTTAPSTVWIVHDSGAGPGGSAAGTARCSAGPGAWQVSQTALDPAELGIPRSAPADLKGGNPEHNAEVVRAFVAGRPGPVRDTVLLNAAAALAADAGVPGPEALVQALADGYRRASAAVDSGAAADLLERWTAASKRLAPKM